MASVSSSLRFDVAECLGSGGFGDVYLATMVTEGGLSRKVALKTLKAASPDDAAWRRLRDEARLLALLHHPAVLQIIDQVALEGRPALVTEYVAGQDLSELIRSAEPLPLRAVLEVTEAVAGALAAAFDTPGPDGRPLRLVHRDIKPANIRLGPGGVVKLLDFGIAIADTAREAVTESGMVVGTLAYLPPERLEDARCFRSEGDVYALGCVLYEALSGARLFTGNVTELLSFAARPELQRSFVAEKLVALPALLEAPARLAEGLRALMGRMLSPVPGERPSAAEIEETCTSLAASAPGLTLRGWSRQRVWPPPTARTGPLTGASLHVTGSTDTRGGAARVVRRISGSRLWIGIGLAAASGSLLVLAAVSAWAWFAFSAEPGVASLPVGGASVGEASVAAPGTASIATEGATSSASGRSAASSPPETEGTVGASVSVAPGIPPASAASATTASAPTTRPSASSSASASRSAPPPTTAPESTPAPASTTAPAKEASVATGTVVVKGSATVLLKGSGGSFHAGPVPAGSYEIWADFGGGSSAVGTAKVTAGASVVVQCSKLTLSCEAS